MDIVTIAATRAVLGDAVSALQEAKTVKASIPQDYNKLSTDVVTLDADMTKVKSSGEASAAYHLGFYVDANGDLCQKDVSNNG